MFKLTKAYREYHAPYGKTILTALKRKGICTHGWLFAPSYGEAHCKECGQVFPNAQAAYDAASEALR